MERYPARWQKSSAVAAGFQSDGGAEWRGGEPNQSVPYSPLFYACPEMSAWRIFCGNELGAPQTRHYCPWQGSGRNKKQKRRRRRGGRRSAGMFNFRKSASWSASARRSQTFSNRAPEENARPSPNQRGCTQMFLYATLFVWSCRFSCTPLRGCLNFAKLRGPMLVQEYAGVSFCTSTPFK